MLGSPCRIKQIRALRKGVKIRRLHLKECGKLPAFPVSAAFYAQFYWKYSACEGFVTPSVSTYF